MLPYFYSCVKSVSAIERSIGTHMQYSYEIRSSGLSFRLVISSLEFDSLTQSDRNTLKVDIHSFPA